MVASECLTPVGFGCCWKAPLSADNGQSRCFAARLGSGADRYLPWDRRVSLALVLAQAGRVEQARAQVERCLREASDPRLRSLTTGSLFNLLVIAHALRLEFQDPGLRDLALDLLPGDLRNRL